MKKILIAIITFFVLILGAGSVYAGVTDIGTSTNIGGEVNPAGIDVGDGGGVEAINKDVKSILSIAKTVIQALLVVFIVYIGVQMIIANGGNDEELSKAKRQLYYAITGIIFINIPGVIAGAIVKTPGDSGLGSLQGDGSNFKGSEVGLITNKGFLDTVNNNLVNTFEVVIGVAAMLMIIITALRLLTARGRSERIEEAKTKIVYYIFALVFVGFIELFKNTVFSGSIESGQNLFEQVSNLAIFFAGPVGITFIILAGYYYLTANGDEERAKKGKNIFINTIIATLILLSSWLLLNEINVVPSTPSDGGTNSKSTK